MVSFIVVCAILVIILYLMAAPVLMPRPSFITSLIPLQHGGLQNHLIIGFFFIFFSFPVFMMFWYQYEVEEANPLTPAEINDPLTREVVITGTLDDAYDVCIRSLDAIPSVRWYILPDRPNRALIAWPLWGEATKINFVFTLVEAERIRVVITSTPYYRLFSHKNKKWRDNYPAEAYAHDYHRRVAIDSLDMILKEIRLRRL